MQKSEVTEDDWMVWDVINSRGQVSFLKLIITCRLFSLVRKGLIHFEFFFHISENISFFLI